MHKDIGALVDGLLVGVDPIGMVAGYYSNDKFLFLGHLAGKYALGREYTPPCGHKQMDINNCDICYSDFHGYREPNLDSKIRRWDEKIIYGAGAVSGFVINANFVGMPQLFALGFPLCKWIEEKFCDYGKKMKSNHYSVHSDESE